jgi:hypothetical protein
LVCQSCFSKTKEAKEQQEIKPPETIKYGPWPPKIERCPNGYEFDPTLGKCVKLPKKTAPELQGVREQGTIPTLPPEVRPRQLTPQERLDIVEKEIAEIKDTLARIEGILSASHRRRWFYEL